MTRLGVPARIALGVGAVALAVVLFLLLRPDSEEETQPQPPPPPPVTNMSTQARTDTSPPPPLPPPPPPVTRINIIVRGGEVLGGIRRVRVDKGRRVVLLVRSDVADHVHLHGYDRFRDVAPGAPARLRFRANLTGRFEVELEDRSFQIAEIEVRP
jgi:hypothetical protein